MNIVIVGDGKMGFALAQNLSKEGHDIMIIDSNPNALRNASNLLDVGCIPGNGISSDVLMEAGVNAADLLIAVTSKDEINIICCLIARKLGARHTIARVRDPQYAQNLAILREDLGLSMQVNPELEAATEISRIIRFPSAQKVDFFARGKVEVVEVRLAGDSPLKGRPLRYFKGKNMKVLICAVQRGDEVCIPDGDFVLEAGDIISITASPKDITTFFKSTGLMLQRKIRSVMIVGGGRTSYYLTRLLLDADIQVKIIEMNRDRCKELADAFPKAMVIYGDGSDRETLHEENIDDTDAFAALTGLDEENVVISMYALMRKVGKVITKVNHIGFSEVLEKTGIDCVITPHLISTHQIVRYVRAMQNSLGSHVESLTRMVNGQVEALEFRVRDTFRGLNIPLRDVQLKKNLLIASIIRNGRLIYPHGNDAIHAGDSVIVVTTIAGLEELNDILA